MNTVNSHNLVTLRSLLMMAQTLMSDGEIFIPRDKAR